jgi:hypothetical protein
MRRKILQFACVLSLLLVAAPSLVAQGPGFEVMSIAAVPPEVKNKRVCVSPTETQIDKCPTNVGTQNCPSGNCDWNYTSCRMWGPNPNNEYTYAISEVEDHEIENPKEVNVSENGVKVENDGEKVCYKRQSCYCERVPGVSADCITKPQVTEVVIVKWRKTAEPCVKVKSLDPDEEPLPYLP